MSQITIILSDLKYALQDLESAVQQPRDERTSIDQVLDKFPSVIRKFEEVIEDVLASQGVVKEHPHEKFVEAFNRGWLKGDLSLWLRLISDYQQMKEEDTSGAKARSLAQDVRACSCILWETYELLTARFRWQTQLRPFCKLPMLCQGSAPAYAGQRL